MGNLKAGAGKSEILFPQEIFPIEGFVGVHDNPCARILVLDNGIRAVLVSLDLVMVPDDMIDELRETVAKSTGAEKKHVWVHVTHSTATPHPPRVLPPGIGDSAADERGRRQRELFCQAVTMAVKVAAEQAAVLQEALLGADTAECDINVNRDIPTPHGWWIGTDGEGPSNKKMTVIRVDDLQNNMIGLLLNYGIKPCTVDLAGKEEGKRWITADVTGFACRMLEEKYQVPVLFFMGASGDQVPKKQACYEVCQEDGSVGFVDFGTETGFQLVEEYGLQMGEVAMETVNGLICGKVPDIVYRKTTFRWPVRDRVPLYPRTEFSYEPNGKEVELPVEVLTVGDVALVGEKPEVCCATELALKEASPFSHTLLTVMVNGGFKYMPDQASYDRITWEAMNSALMPGAAEKFLEVAGELLMEAQKERQCTVTER